MCLGGRVMLNHCCVSVVPRYQYEVNTKAGKADGQPLNAKDYLELGYMAGRFGLNLNGKPGEINSMKKTEDGVRIDINSCAAMFFEKKLQKEGIKFDRIA